MSGSVTLERCEVCRALVDVEDLFCPNCGTEVPDRRESATSKLSLGAHNFGCQNCGASMSYDASAQSLKCPFCGSTDLKDDGTKGILKPDCVIPFAIDQAEAQGRLLGFLGSSMWHPGDLKSGAQLTELTAVYVPFWVFSTSVTTHWTGDTSHTGGFSNSGWAPLSGYREANYDNLWIPASEGVTVGELAKVIPYDIHRAVPPEQVDFSGRTVEQFSLSRKYARPLAQQRLEELEAMAVAQVIPGQHRNIHVNVLMQDAESQAALAPLYVMAYRYKSKLYRFVINGQTGLSTGSAPISAAKVALAIGGALLLILIGAAFLLR